MATTFRKKIVKDVGTQKIEAFEIFLNPMQLLLV